MDYISSKNGKQRSNEPYEISINDIRYMLKQNEQDKKECQMVTNSSYNGDSYYPNDGRAGNGKMPNDRLGFFKEILYRDPKTEGFVMVYPHGRIITQGERNSYFRGEKEIYPKTQPTIFRLIEDLDKEKKIAQRFISEMRIVEFEMFIRNFDIVAFWERNYGTVLFEALAQHYGLDTCWLDITSDFEVALFFANCKWDNQKRKWYPLTKDDTEVSEKKKYGVIFHIPGWRADLQRDLIMPVGYQPFMRCHSQHAYSMPIDKPMSLQDNNLFEKLYFRHDERLAKEIFEKMDFGRKIYPNEGLDEFFDIIRQIKETKVFSKKAYEVVLATNKYYSSDSEAKSSLNGLITIMEDTPIKISRQRRRRLNKQYENFSLEEKYNLKLLTRKVYRPTVSNINTKE